MTDLLTESYCERCGTRFEFGAEEPLSRTRKTRGLVSGLRNYIMSTDSLSDAIGDAMQAEEQAIAARQIDAFQETFSFCLECRRYTCTSCWNDDAGRCRTCEPVPGVDDVVGMEERLAQAAQAAVAAQAPREEPSDAAPAVKPPEPAWPSEEGLVTAEARPAAEAWPAGDSVGMPAEAETPDIVEGSPPPPDVVPGFVTAAGGDPGGEPLSAEPLAAEADRSAEVIAEAAEPSEVEAGLGETGEPEPEPEIRVTGRRDLRETFARGPLSPAQPETPATPVTPTARQSQLDLLGIEDPGQGVVHVGQRDQLPYRSSGAGSTPASAAALGAVWTASSRHLEAGARRAALRHCGGCGLTVSATARFCRRCGTPQTLSA